MTHDRHITLEPAMEALAAGDWPTARAEALAYLGAQPRSAQGFLTLATALVSQGDLDKTLLALGQSLGLDAGVASAYHLLGLVLQALGQPTLAERAFATVLQLDADHPHAVACRLACRGRAPEHPLSPLEAEAVERLLGLATPTVTACLIVRDEAKNLPGCLASLNGWVDEIVVVDTGSTDETVAIAESFGAKVGHFAWCDDFSAARNASLELATFDWILVIDADEQLQIDDHLVWRRALQRREFGGYVIHQRNLQDDGSVYNDAPVLRLFQRHEAIRFGGRLHEGVGDAITSLGWHTQTLAGARLVHTGYQTQVVQGQAKGERNLAIALRAAQEQPDDPFTLLQLARSHCFNHQPAAAVPVFERVMAMPGTADMPLVVWANLVTTMHEALLAVGRPLDAEAVLSKGLARIPGFPEFSFERGRVRFRLGKVDAAEADFKACLAAHGRTFELATRPGLTDVLPRQALAELAAARVLPVPERAGEAAGDVPMVPLEAATEAIRRGQWQTAKELLISHLTASPRSAAGFRALAMV
ncbi:MAG: glycosyltransferase, partial [Candidatus Sericytochromatia bacterium]